MINLFFFTQILFANPHCPSDLKQVPQIKELKLKVQEKMKVTSNLVTISSEADRVLGRLTRSKNPTFTNWLHQQGFLAGNPLAIASQWRNYYLQNYILNKYPTPKPDVNTSIEGLFQDIQKLAFQDKFKTKIKKTYAEAKKDSLKYIEGLKLKNSDQNALKSRIEKLDLYWLQTLKGGPFQNRPLDFLNSGLTYDEKTHQILVGLKTHELPDQASLFAVLVQNIAQSFAPCLWPQHLSDHNPFVKLQACLRERDSANAQPRDDQHIQQWVFKKIVSEDNVKFLEANPLCNLKNYPPPGAQHEQINSVFSDWFAAEVLAQSDYQKDTIRADLCLFGSAVMSSMAAELSPQQRLKRIYYVQPKIKATLSSDSSFKYCSFFD